MMMELKVHHEIFSFPFGFVLLFVYVFHGKKIWSMRKLKLTFLLLLFISSIIPFNKEVLKLKKGSETVQKKNEIVINYLKFKSLSVGDENI